jgi:CDGSH-type Zn-finger protein
MTAPDTPQKAPYGLDLEAGTYWWCACGKSARQPFCDGSHKGTEFTPAEFTLKEKTKVWLCGCKHTQSKPYCDGTHSKL